MQFEPDKSEKAMNLFGRICITFGGSLFYGKVFVALLNWLVVPIARDSQLFYYVALALSPLSWWLTGVALRQRDEREGGRTPHLAYDIQRQIGAFFSRLFRTR